MKCKHVILVEILLIGIGLMGGCANGITEVEAEGGNKR